MPCVLLEAWTATALLLLSHQHGEGKLFHCFRNLQNSGFGVFSFEYCGKDHPGLEVSPPPCSPKRRDEHRRCRPGRSTVVYSGVVLTNCFLSQPAARTLKLIQARKEDALLQCKQVNSLTQGQTFLTRTFGTNNVCKRQQSLYPRRRNMSKECSFKDTPNNEF